ncbi:Alpha/Beta hydrolase protein [Chlamydoabsidia padenii]|nr:Alpha/Beta hydrolase protein [Chlamydoabsidia padenii]
MRIYYLSLSLVFFTWGACGQYQHSFQLNDASDQQQLQQRMTLQSVYHHSSPSGPTPGLFRRFDLSNLQQQQQRSDDSSYSISMVAGHYERLNKPTKNYLIQQADTHRQSLSSYHPRRIRWQHLKSLTATNMDILKESVYDWIPNVTNRSTILSLAMMTNNAYSGIDNTTDWYDLGEPWHLNTSFGWDSDGVRGHVFGNHNDSLFIISFKGTSVGLWKDGPTGEKDKINDNMLFSCCCARISRAWTPVCDCYQENEYICKNDCLEKNILMSEFYYDHAMAIYLDVVNLHPNATIWLTGHSLGGALASLVGQTYGVPAVSFEAPGNQLASIRLHLSHYKNMPVWQFGHSADPIWSGDCIGPSSSCWYGGFAMESKCHTGQVCEWDTVKEHGWRVDARTHRIRSVIEDILNQTEASFPLPKCNMIKNCSDCELWTYIDKRDGNQTTTSTTQTATATATEPPEDPWF